jgi:hypothetical protein
MVLSFSARKPSEAEHQISKTAPLTATFALGMLQSQGE